MRTYDVEKPLNGQTEKRNTDGKNMTGSLEPVGAKTYESKFIRGPTQSRRGYFRTTRNANDDVEPPLSAVKMEPEGGKRPQVALLASAESVNAQWQTGRLDDGRMVSYIAHKKPKTITVNTSSDKQIDLVRAKQLHSKAITTYSERINDAFCHLLPKGTTSAYFMRYLEEAALDSETADIAQAFPFLQTTSDKKKLNELLRLKDASKPSGETEQKQYQNNVDEINQSIALLRAKIYDDRLKIIQFKKRLDLLLQQEEVQSETDEAFWLWVLLKKLLKAIEEALAESDNKSEVE